jgi:hypothetical protein
MSNSTLYLAAPEGKSWPIDLEAAEGHFRHRWPDAYMSRQVSAVTGQPYLTFDLVNGLRGIYSAHTHCLSLSEGSPEDWAETIVWFLSLLPKGVPVVAMADGDFRLVPVGPAASVPEIKELYERLAAGLSLGRN